MRQRQNCQLQSADATFAANVVDVVYSESWHPPFGDELRARPNDNESCNLYYVIIYYYYFRKGFPSPFPDIPWFRPWPYSIAKWSTTSPLFTDEMDPIYFRKVTGMRADCEPLTCVWIPDEHFEPLNVPEEDTSAKLLGIINYIIFGWGTKRPACRITGMPETKQMNFRASLNMCK